MITEFALLGVPLTKTLSRLRAKAVPLNVCQRDASSFNFPERRSIVAYVEEAVPAYHPEVLPLLAVSIISSCGLYNRRTKVVSVLGRAVVNSLSSVTFVKISPPFERANKKKPP